MGNVEGFIMSNFIFCTLLIVGVHITIVLYCICFDEVVIAAQCTATFPDLLCSHYWDVNMPIKFCSDDYFFRLEIL